MIDRLNFDAIHINNINLWAHVGVLDDERLLGQDFILDITIWVDVEKAAVADDLSLTVDYSLAVQGLQKLALETKCLTIEAFSEEILHFLDDLYGPIPKQILLQKCNPPIPGFTGSVSLERWHHRND